MTYLAEFTFFVNYCAFIIVLWLGLYLVLHNPKYPISWLTALTLWSLATLFLHYLLEPTFWLNRSFEYSSNSWFQGFAVAPALAFWHHATTLTRPRKLNPWRWLRILTAYLLAIAAVVVQATTQIWHRSPGGNLLYLNSRQAGPLYPFFGVALLLFIAASMINLIRSARATPATMPRKQLLTLVWATLFAGLTGPAMIIGMILGLPIPSAVISILLAMSVGFIGYGVARYSALMEGRTIHRDFFYNLIMISFVAVVYIPVCWIFLQVFKAPPIIFILIPVLAVLTHSLVNPAYRLIDGLLLDRDTRDLRSDLRQLARFAFEGDSLAVNLKRAIKTLCHSVNASYGVVLTFDEGSIRPIANFQQPADVTNLAPSDFKSDDGVHINPGQLAAPFEEAALLIPLYQENEQIGALILGQPVNGTRYAEEDMERILNPTEIIGEAIQRYQLRTQLMDHLTQFTGTRYFETKEPLPIEMVEDSLRNLDNYAYLSDSPLAELGLVQIRLPRGFITHLDRGKVVREVFLEAINKLNPGTETLQNPPPREWYPYLILKYAYLEGISNRDIMMRLYISEGTFNRTRRAAIRSVARTLDEMESNLL